MRTRERHTYACRCIATDLYKWYIHMYIDTVLQIYVHIVIQNIALQSIATDTQPGTDQLQTTTNDAASEQQSFVERQSTPPDALLNYKPKNQGVSS